MTYKEALDYINSVRLNQWKLGLSRTRELLNMLGDPQNSLRFVHVGGTNGKGSTCAMIESVLRAADYRTGVFPSPYIEEFRERIQVNGIMISEEDLCSVTEEVKACADKMEDEPSHFEIVTAIGMMYFSRMKCDMVVLEVGLGGEFDATNIIEAPEVAVLTNIGFDHTDYLGSTLAEIARTKSGIIKTGSSVVVYPNVDEVMDVISGICAERACPMKTVDFDRIRIERADLDGQVLMWDEREIRIPLIGEYQSRNAAVALTVIEELRTRGWMIPDEAVKNGMAGVSWPARFEVLGKDPLFILDGGHNLQCAEAVAESVSRYIPGGKVTLIIGMLRDKDYEAVLEIMLPYASKCVCLAPESERALPAEELAKLIRNKGITAESMDSAVKAVRQCINGTEPVLAFGSFYMAGEIRSAYRKEHKRKLRRAAIAAREGLSGEERIEFSRRICGRIFETPEYRAAKTVFVYKWVKGEVKLDAFEERAAQDGKRLVYPLCVSDTEMITIEPGTGEDAWTGGYKGIIEPVREKGTVVGPADIDLVIAPCSSFDEECRRLGMGGGFYDRYLPKCVNASVIAVAFEAQKMDRIPTDQYDQPVDAVATEERIYRAE